MKMMGITSVWLLSSSEMLARGVRSMLQDAGRAHKIKSTTDLLK